MGNKILTISREYGSGGRDIARMAAEKLGIPCYDQEIIEKISEDVGYTSDYIEEHGEAMPYSSWIGNALSIGGGNDAAERLWASQCRVIRGLAEKEPCVIVGRCADRVLAEDFDVVSVYIHADLKKRCERAVSFYGADPANIEKTVGKIDKRRKAYYEMYTDCEWGFAGNYTFSLDSGRIGLEECADLIVSLYNGL